MHDSKYREQLQEDLRNKRRLLYINEMRIAHQGMMYAGPALIIRAEDLRREIAQIEAWLGIADSEDLPGVGG